MRSTALCILLLACAPSSELSPLIAAARSGDAAQVARLAKEGADLNQPAGVNAWMPLMHAVHKQQIGAMAALLDAGADPNRATARGETPLMMAAGYGYTDMVRLLLARGANPRLADAGGATALDYARDGMNDIDRFTIFRCQDEAARALLAADPAQPRARSWWAKAKRCV